MVQWLRLRAPCAGGEGLVTGRGRSMLCGVARKENKKSVCNCTLSSWLLLRIDYDPLECQGLDAGGFRAKV